MKNVILVPDSFKGTMRSSEVCAIMKKAILAYYPDCRITEIPIADGGEGTVDAFLFAYRKGVRKTIRVRGPYEEDVEAFWGLMDSTAVIEMAACAGLPLTKQNRNPLITTTYGVGQLIRAALDEGCTKIIVGLGGSGTNDGGCGIAAALGARFTDEAGEDFIPVGGTLQRIRGIDLAGLDSRLKDVEIIAVCDIDNPLYGLQGAAYIFGPQKGADAQAVALLDRGLRHLDAMTIRNLHIQAADVPGAGAAGGCGFGMKVFLGAHMKMGIDTLLDSVGFDDLLKEADYVFTGEGKIDGQSLRGKVVSGVARRACKFGIPVIAVVGDIADDAVRAYEQGIAAIFSTNRTAVDFSLARCRCARDMELTMDNLIRFVKLIETRTNRTFSEKTRSGVDDR